MTKVHLAVSKENDYGGYSYDTLCGRESAKTDEVNAEPDKSEVDCALCLKIMTDKKHWRNRKWLIAD